MASCCPDLEKLIRPGGTGIGLLLVTNRRGSRFILEYRKDWQVPIAEDGIQIKFCPFCGSKLTGPSLVRNPRPQPFPLISGNYQVLADLRGIARGDFDRRRQPYFAGSTTCT
jgi:hypothetical protein